MIKGNCFCFAYVSILSQDLRPILLCVFFFLFFLEFQSATEEYTMFEHQKTETFGISQQATQSSFISQPFGGRGAWGMLVATLDGSCKPLIGRTSFGRTSSCQITFDDPKISGKHFEIYFEEETRRRAQDSPDHYANEGSPTLTPFGISYWIQDWSTNGTFVNHRKVGKKSRMRIHTGDDVSVVWLPPGGDQSRKRNRGEDIGVFERQYLLTFVFHAFASQSTDPSPTLGPLRSFVATPPLHSEPEPLPPTLLSRPWSVEDAKETPISWQWGTCIGRGAFSQVFLGINTSNGEMIAVKVLKDMTAVRGDSGTIKTTDASDPLQEDEDWELDEPQRAASFQTSMFDLERSCTVLMQKSTSQLETRWDITEEQRAELRLLRSLRHRRIVQYLGFAVQDNQVCILLEYVAGGSLKSLIDAFQSFTESVVRIYSVQILQGLEFLHFHHVVHGDIKPHNILVSDKGQIKLSDFGTGKILRRQENGAFHADIEVGDEPRTLQGTPLWMSPELVRTTEPSFAADIWAFGCVVLEMASGCKPWSEFEHFSETAPAIFGIGHATQGPSLEKLRDKQASENLLSFLEATFTLDPSHRPTASQLLTHPFITNSTTGRQTLSPPHEETAAARTDGKGRDDGGASASKFADHLNFLREANHGAEESPRRSTAIVRRDGGTDASSPPQPSGLTAKMRVLETCLR